MARLESQGHRAHQGSVGQQVPLVALAAPALQGYRVYRAPRESQVYLEGPARAVRRVPREGRVPLVVLALLVALGRQAVRGALELQVHQVSPGAVVGLVHPVRLDHLEARDPQGEAAPLERAAPPEIVGRREAVALLGILARPELREARVHLVVVELVEALVVPGRLEPQVAPDRQARVGLLEPLVALARQERQEQVVQVVALEDPDLLVDRAAVARLDRVAPRGVADPLGDLESAVVQAAQAHLDLVESLELRAHLGQVVVQESREAREAQAHLAAQVHLVSREPVDQVVPQELPVFPARPAAPDLRAVPATLA